MQTREAQPSLAFSFPAIHLRPARKRYSLGLRVDSKIKDDDWLLPFPVPRDRIPDPTHFRSTWLTASQATLRERGHFAAYEKLVDPVHRDAVMTAVAGVWLPMDVARAHYTACDRLALPTPELLEIGAEATRRANATTLSFVARMAQGAGVSPWTILSQSPRMWDRTCKDGGAIGVARLGPKEARLELIGYPFAMIRYNRVTMRGIVHAVVELFCEKAYVIEIPSLFNHRSMGMRLSWA